jgi:acyl-CoA thioester hydrolase
VIGVCAESHCEFSAGLAFPDAVDVHLRVGKLGNSSVRYELAVAKGGEPEPVATGHFVHVFVERESRRPVPIPDRLRAALARLVPAG